MRRLRRERTWCWLGWFFGVLVAVCAQTPELPRITSQPVGVAGFKDGAVVLRVEGTGVPAPVYAWAKDGEIIPGQVGPTLTLAHLQPLDAGVYTVRLVNSAGAVTSQGARVSVGADLGAKSVARWWNEALLDGIR